MQGSYERSQALSYRPGEPLVIPPDKLEGVFQFQFGGSQPFGCTARSVGQGKDEVFVSTYFEPSIMRLVFTRTADGGLVIAVTPIRGVDHGVDSVRIFPGFPGGPFGRENRGREVSVTPESDLWVCRSDRQLFLLKRPETEDGRWRMVRQVSLPDPWNNERWVHSMRVDEGTEETGVIDTIEGVAHAAELTRRRYTLNQATGVALENFGGELPATDWVYGWGTGRSGNDMWFVTDARCTRAHHGIYRGTTLVCKDPGDASLTGTGICFLGDGTGIVSQYGQGFPGPFNGREGRITIIPAHLLQG